MKKLLQLNLLFLVAGILSPGIYAQKYTVFGATQVPGVNGVYIENGTYNSHPVYESDAYKIGYLEGSVKWVIVSKTQDWSTVVANGDNYDVKYCSIIDSITPPIIGWRDRAWSSGRPKDKIIVAKLNSIGYHTNVFVESVQDDGTFNDTVHLYLYSETDHFTGSDGDDFVAGGQVVVTNLPAVLSAEVIKTSDSTALAIVSGTATAHSFADNINNLSLSFQNSAFAGNDASTIEGSLRDNLQIIFIRKYIVSEANLNPAANGEYVLKGIFDGKPYYLNNDQILYYKGCSPKWALAPMNGIHPYYSTALNLTNPENFEWYQRSYGQVGESVIVSTPNSIVYNDQAFYESVRDNGQFPDTLDLRLYYPASGNGFTGSVGEDFAANGKIVIQNTPAGLTSQVIKTSDTTLAFVLSGTATNHTTAGNISNLSYAFTNDAFASGDASLVENSAVDTLKIFYQQKYFVRNVSNSAFKGIYSLQTMLNSRAGYVNSIGNTEMVFRNTGNSFWVLRIRNVFNPCSYSHGTFSEAPPATGWHVGDYDGTGATSIEVIPLTGNWIECRKTRIYETSANNGAIADTIEIWLLSQTITLSGADGEDFGSTGKIGTNHLPEGLVVNAIRVDNKTLKFYLTGQALNNNPSDATDSLQIELNDNAFDNSGSEPIQFTQNNVKILFTSNPDLVMQFQEGEFRFYPNPANTLLYIEAGEELKNLTVSVINTSGVTLVRKSINTRNETLDLAAFPSGMYLLKAETKENSMIRKFVIQH